MSALPFLLLYVLATTARAGVVDRVVLVVDEELVLASDLALESEIAALDVPPVPFWRIDHDDVGTRLEEAALVRALAAGVAIYQPEDSAVDARVQLLRERAGSEAAWQDLRTRWGLQPAALHALIRRRMAVERYLTRNLPEDPSDTSAWLAACHALLEQVRPRFIVRTIAPRGDP